MGGIFSSESGSDEYVKKGNLNIVRKNVSNLRNKVNKIKSNNSGRANSNPAPHNMGRGNNNNNNNNNNNMPPLEGATPNPPTVATPNPPTPVSPNPTAATPNPTGKSTPPLPPLLNNGNSSGSNSKVNKRNPVLAIENVSSASSGAASSGAAPSKATLDDNGLLTHKDGSQDKFEIGQCFSYRDDNKDMIGKIEFFNKIYKKDAAPLYLVKIPNTLSFDRWSVRNNNYESHLSSSRLIKEPGFNSQFDENDNDQLDSMKPTDCPKPSPKPANLGPIAVRPPNAVRPPAALPITNASKVNNSSLVSAAVNKKDPEGYYKLLGLNSSASQSAIRAAYLRLAKNYHPNRGGNVNKFKFLGEAYEVLKNEESRKKYDEQASIANNKPILAITDPSVKAALAATAELGGEAAAAGAKVEQALQQNPKSLNALRQASAAAAAAKEAAASAEHKSILERLVNVIRPYVEQLSHGGTRNRKRRAHTRSRRNRRNTKKN